MRPTSERPESGNNHEAAEQAAVSASEAYTNVEGSIRVIFDVITDAKDRVDMLREVWASERFTALTPTEQELLKKRFGTGEEVAVAAEPAPEPEVSAPTHAETPGPRERREQNGKPLKRVFKQYRIAHDGINNTLMVVEDVDVYDHAKKAYESKVGIPTKIRLPAALHERIMSNPEVAQAIVDGAMHVRRELDDHGLKLFRDTAQWDITPERAANEREAIVNADGSVERLYLKWKYQIDDDRRKDFVDIDAVPDPILRTLKEKEQYWAEKDWNAWYGPTIQQKREEVISNELLRNIGQGVGEVQGPAMRTTSSNEVPEADEAVVTPEAASTPAKRVEEPVRPVAETRPQATPEQPRREAPTPSEAAPAAPEVVAAPEQPPTLTAEQLHADVDAEIRVNVAAFRTMFGDDTAGLQEQVLKTSTVLLVEKYLRAGIAVDDAVHEKIRTAIREQLDMPAEHAEEPAKVEEVENLETDEFTFRPGHGEEGLMQALQTLASEALVDTEGATFAEAKRVAKAIAGFLMRGGKVVALELEPDVRLVVKGRATILEHMRALHKELYPRDSKT